MITPMRQRSGSAAQWTSANPVLSTGELGFEQDTNRVKIGNGVDAWTQLDYFIAAEQILAILSEALEDFEPGTGGGNPNIIDGGSPASTEVELPQENLLDGGNPTRTDFYAPDGTLFDGGNPTSTSANFPDGAVIDGGTPTSGVIIAPSDLLDGGSSTDTAAHAPDGPIFDGGNPTSTAFHLPDGPQIDGGNP